MKNIVIGTTFIDIKGFPESDFAANGRNAGDISYVHGGVGRNIAENLARCGQNPLFISGVDDSPFAGAILHRLAGEGVDTQFMIRNDHALGSWLAVFDSEGDVAASISKRPELSEIADLLDRKAEEIFADADSISVEIDMDPVILDKVHEHADRRGIPVFAVVSNMKIAIEQEALHRHIHCLVCNLQEAGLIVESMRKAEADLSNLSPQELLAVLKETMAQLPIDNVIVTMGGDGAVYLSKMTGEEGWIPAAPAEVCDTTGAGDAFFSGVVMGLTRRLARQGSRRSGARAGSRLNRQASLEEACQIGALLASKVIATRENVCPRMGGI
ncbi:MAG: carbohydrate kinase family protein [Eubacterium sp.]|nr:carbohydrate kinase family protein [Eubacterium sp.]